MPLLSYDISVFLTVVRVPGELGLQLSCLCIVLSGEEAEICFAALLCLRSVGRLLYSSLTDATYSRELFALMACDSTTVTISEQEPPLQPEHSPTAQFDSQCRTGAIWQLSVDIYLTRHCSGSGSILWIVVKS